jgi:potassium voltage-gated channel Eag-related subfamily H protein 6/hyperpolarization activated cyclic nucleotide-gated potassium channel 2
LVKGVFYPDDPYRSKWELFITVILILTCFMTPFALGFVDGDSDRLLAVETIVDVVFLIDIVMNFKFAYWDQDYEIVDNRKIIAYKYLKSWFIVDFLAVLPFNLILKIVAASYGHSLEGNLGRVPKLMKLASLVRILKINQERNKILQLISKIFSLQGGIDRILFFVMLFLTLTHINACLWVYIAKFDPDNPNTWINMIGMADHDDFELYVSSFYFVITTITTVGYGDITAFNTTERIFCCMLMIIGVLAFSFSTGSLSSFQTQHDSSQAILREKMNTLNQINQQYHISPNLFDEIRRLIKYEHQKSKIDLKDFQNSLPD